MSAPIQAVDLFCGAGGTTTGLLLAAADLGLTPRMLAVNHWNVAIDTHTRNHPGVTHLCETLDNVDPVKAVPGGHVRLLCASPECTHHSNARGGKPRSDQSRATAWHIPRWATALTVDDILIENVREFMKWGPLTRKGKPDKRYIGRYFRAFCETLANLGYQLEHAIVNAADYGDATTRPRFLLMARRNGKPAWPAPTHAGRWRAAREVIDWDLQGKSIFTRKKPLSANTVRRIESGLRKFSGLPFVVQIDQTGGRGCLRSASQPLGTIVTEQNFALVQAFLLNLRGTKASQLEGSARLVSEPVPTLTTSGGHVALCEPFLTKYYGTSTGHYSVADPLATVTTKDRFALVAPTVEIQGERHLLDIRFRMLQPGECSAAMGFPADYQFTGTRKDRMCQIGNAVPVQTARAFCRASLS